MFNRIVNDYKNLPSTEKEMVNVCSCFGIAMLIGILVETLSKLF